MKLSHALIFIILLLCVVVGPTGLIADTSEINPGKSHSKVDQGEHTAPVAELPSVVFEFAPVIDGTEILHDFTIRNTGNAELRIKQIKTG